LKYVISLIAFVIVLFYAYPVIFGPSNVIEAVDIFVENDNIVVQIDFSIPVRYENHFPEKKGEMLQVKCRLVSLAQIKRKEIVNLGTLRPELVKQISLMNITFEGGVQGGPYLTLLFSEPVEYQVKESPQLKSMFVIFAKNKTLNNKS